MVRRRRPRGVPGRRRRPCSENERDDAGRTADERTRRTLDGLDVAGRVGSKPASLLPITRPKREAKPSPRDKSFNQPCASRMGKFPAFLSSEMVTDVGHFVP